MTAYLAKCLLILSYLAKCLPIWSNVCLPDQMSPYLEQCLPI
jgi:hypothetical protein